MPTTYYDILEVPQSASSEEIKKAYRHLAQEFHPDKLTGIPPKVAKLAEEKFNDVQEAYEVLTKNRAEYDTRLRAAVAAPPDPQQNGRGRASAPAPAPPRPRPSQAKARASKSVPSSVPPSSHSATKNKGNIWRGLGKVVLWVVGVAVAIFLMILVAGGSSKRSRRS